MRSSGDPNPSLTALVGVVGALVLFAVIVALQAFFYWAEKGEEARKAAAQGPSELVRLRSEQEETLGAYRWLDQPRGVVAIPIERAMELVTSEETGNAAERAER